jgi:hypothetical protein
VERLSEFQYRALAKVANRENKVVILFSAQPGTEDENTTNLEFNEFLQLIELGFFLEMDREHQEYTRLLKQFDQKGVHLVMAEMTNRGQWMWEQTEHEKWIN